MDVVNAPRRLGGPPFAPEDWNRWRHSSSLPNQQRLSSSTHSTFAAVYTAAGLLGDTATTSSTVPVVVVGSLTSVGYLGIFLAQNKHHMDVFDPPPRPVGSPFPRNHRATLAAPPSLYIQRLLFSKTPGA
ncbi:hypothetical protein ARMGADRAFT_295535 [Armillaria gallica]|uniref:Uncharacterized protein n=1 Tax=Armillaria gallica TaxID=47427 RepID=A0A2H3CIL5_ARMGA|nr:hypothetical protein ARMGADRAFT_295535 [Armillaria gallica]